MNELLVFQTDFLSKYDFNDFASGFDFPSSEDVRPIEIQFLEISNKAYIVKEFSRLSDTISINMSSEDRFKLQFFFVLIFGWNYTAYYHLIRYKFNGDTFTHEDISKFLIEFREFHKYVNQNGFSIKDLEF